MTYLWAPYLCGITRNQMDLAIGFTINLGSMFTQSVTLFDPFFYNTQGVPGFMGTQFPPPTIGNYKSNQGATDFDTMLLNCLKQLGTTLTNNVNNWNAILTSGVTDLANAAKAFLQNEINAGIGAARTALEAVFKPVYSEICTSFYWYDPNTCVSYWPVTQVCHLQGGGNCHTSGGDCHTSCSWSGLKLRCNTNCNPVVTTCDPIYSVCNNIGGGCAIWQPLVLRCGTYVNTCMLNCF